MHRVTHRQGIRRLRARQALLPIMVLLIGTVGCGNDSTKASDTSAASSSAVVASDSSAGSSSASAESSKASSGSASTATNDTASTTTGKVSANDATVAELTEAFTAAGVTNASRWAQEVDEYRPYESSDTEFGALYDELSKYGIDDETFNKIVSVLEL